VQTIKRAGTEEKSIITPSNCSQDSSNTASATILSWQKPKTALPMDVMMAHSVGLDGRICTFFTANDHFWELDFWLVGLYATQEFHPLHL